VLRRADEAADDFCRIDAGRYGGTENEASEKACDGECEATDPHPGIKVTKGLMKQGRSVRR
jgi:hypothetical protein